jgi:hypothetical protein
MVHTPPFKQGLLQTAKKHTQRLVLNSAFAIMILVSLYILWEFLHWSSVTGGGGKPLQLQTALKQTSSFCPTFPEPPV